MTNFPGGKFEVPNKLSPFVDDSVRQPILADRASSSVVSVFAEPSVGEDILRKSDFAIPQCYFRSYIQGESEFKLKPQHLKQFTPQTLFYCFHNLPGDILQVLAAQELSSRGWRYHSEIKRWFRVAASGDVPTSSGLIHFDPTRWEERPYPNNVEQSKFMPGSEHIVPANVNVGGLKSGPPGRQPPASPPTLVPQPAPVTPSSVVR
jgi:hypothetical protein